MDVHGISESFSSAMHILKFLELHTFEIKSTKNRPKLVGYFEKLIYISIFKDEIKLKNKL